MKITLLSLMITILLPLAGHAADELIASSRPYSVVLRTEDDGQSAVALICKEAPNGYEVLGADEDIIASIDKLVPKDAALPLAVAYLKTVIEEGGGRSAVEKSLNASIAKYGNYLHPLAIKAYGELGVHVKGGGQ